MYSPDGFASLACALHHQCFFLEYQPAFIKLMYMLNQNIYYFFGLQIIIWLLTITMIYFIAKELKTKHLFLTPLILLFSTTFFIDNWVGNFENDQIGIFLLLLAQLFLIKYYYKNTNLLKSNLLNLLTGIFFITTSLHYWFWIGHLKNFPRLISRAVEEMFWTHWASWLIIFPIIILLLYKTIKNKNYIVSTLILIILFFPKLFFIIIPFLIKFIDEILDKMLKIPSKKELIFIIMFALVLGQFIRVGINTYNSWNRTVEDENCVTVNDEYFLRATKGLNYSYNQLSIEDVIKCKTKT